MSRHVLTVDDDPLIRRLVQLNLTRAGYRVTTASDGVEALEQLKNEVPDLVVLDITMPRMDGIELLRRLKADARTEKVPVVMLTAKAQDQDVFEAERSGASCYLNKPFHPTELLDTIQRTLSEG
ncbi:MAG: response regulator [Armatimonadota bacterium]